MQDSALSPTCPPSKTPINRQITRRLAPLLTVVVLLTLWQVIVSLKVYPTFIIPPPRAVWDTLAEVVTDGTLLRHAATTMAEIALGMSIGVGLGVLMGYLIAKSRLLEDLLSPILVTMQSTPVVAYAPLLVIWFRGDLTGKIITCALIVLFPVLINTMVGVRDVPAALRDLMTVFGASRWQMFTKLEIPSAMPVLLGGLKVSATLAVIGAVVGEFINADSGLGFLIKLARDQYDTPLVIVAVLTLALIARLMYGTVSLMEAYALRWQQRNRKR